MITRAKPRRLEPEESLADDARLEAADLKLLAVREKGHVRTAGHDVHLHDQIDVHQRLAAEPDEARRIEPRFEILEPIRGDMIPGWSRERSAASRMRSH